MSHFMQDITSNAYFQSLPQWVKESIIQGPLDVRNEDELRLFVNQLMQADKPR